MYQRAAFMAVCPVKNRWNIFDFARSASASAIDVIHHSPSREEHPNCSFDDYIS
jgi:hypothetical protein